MELKEKAIISILEKEQQPLPVLSELSEVLQRLPEISEVKLKKGYVDNTKGEINIALEIFLAIGTNILSSFIYDILKNIWRGIGKKNNILRIEINSQEQTEVIELCYDSQIEDIKITVKKK